jgi:3-isopropylmalate dehydrogenase
LISIAFVYRVVLSIATIGLICHPEAMAMKIAVMPGDFVGKEVIAQGIKLLDVTSRKFGFKYETSSYPFGAEHYLKTGVTLPESALKELAAHDAILFGAVGADPRGNAQIPQGLIETDILLKMRFELDQYINLRPTRLIDGVPTPLAKVKSGDIDMIIVRENTEGLYCQNGGFLYKGTAHEVANQIEVTTRHGVERCVRFAFQYARTFLRKKVTLVAKTNVLRFAHNLWLRTFEEVASEYPGIQSGYDHVDACTMYMVTDPKRYDVIVTTNMFGDIITDLGAAIQGGMGMAASANLNPTRQAASMFEPVHGSAPDIAGKNMANPIATFLSVAMMLDFLDQPQASAAISAACQDVLADSKNHTRDLGGSATTTQVADVVCAKLA